MDLLVTILIFGVISFLNGSKNKNKAQQRRARQQQLSSKDAPQNTVPRKKTQEQPLPGQALRELARQFGLEEFVPEAPVAKRTVNKTAVKPSNKRPSNQAVEKTKKSSFGQPLGEGSQAKALSDSQENGTKKAPRLGETNRQSRINRLNDNQSKKPIIKPIKLESRNTLGINSIIGIESDSKKVLAQGLLWSQVLSEPRYRQKHYSSSSYRKIS